ncbi:MAG: DUF5682 family protein [Chitinophagaceae bacterium]|nr:DUF5682 family protein [Chitinophagaceae bacterium]
MPVHLFGIRHHGPGSARCLLKALDVVQPDIILIEGPPEAQDILHWAAHPDMQPPVALLAYESGHPQRASFYPFTAYSPEWSALQYALGKKIPVRFADMPLSHHFALQAKAAEEEHTKALEGEPHNSLEPGTTEAVAIEPAINPLEHLASLAGFTDAEAWWEHEIELKDNAIEVFEAITVAMRELRQHFPGRDTEEPLREAFMRRAIRQAQREMYSSIAVVCGAWHAPALAQMPTQKEDDNLLKNLPKTRVETTWIPWTNDRMALASGYGAGVTSPGWYAHLWQHPDDDGTRWLVHTASIFRQHQIDISSAHVIESVRLANTLAALRNLHRPGLTELLESTMAVMCMGNDMPLRLIDHELVVGHNMGTVPDGTPQVPLQQDFEKTLKSLRLKTAELGKVLKLDLREENDLKKSVLLHRLLLLEVPWGELRISQSKGTFKEEWVLYWQPEYTLRLIDKANWGNTLALAANNWVGHLASQSKQLPEVTLLIEKALPADLPQGTETILSRLENLAASTTDTPLLLDAFVPMARVYRYGSVRQTDAGMLGGILASVFMRAVVNLPAGAVNLAADLADELAKKTGQVHAAVLLLENAEFRQAWQECMERLAQNEQTEPLLMGYATRLLYDEGKLSGEAIPPLFSRALSGGNLPVYSARWAEGFLKDGALALLLDELVWQMVTNWLAGLPEAEFTAVVPLLRRTFATYTASEKRKIAEKAANTGGLVAAKHELTIINPEWGLAAIQTFRQIIDGHYEKEETTP